MAEAVAHAGRHERQEPRISLILLGVTVATLVGAATLARRNLRQGRGDRRGAARLAAA